MKTYSKIVSLLHLGSPVEVVYETKTPRGIEHHIGWTLLLGPLVKPGGTA